MARVEVSFFTAGNRSREGGSLPVPHVEGMSTEVVTSSGTSAATTLTSTAAAGTGFVRVLADGDVWVAAGASPTAVVPSAGSSQPGLRAKAGQPLDLAVSLADRVAVIDVA